MAGAAYCAIIASILGIGIDHGYLRPPMHSRVNRIPSTRLRATRRGPLLTPQLAAIRAHRSAARAIIIIIKRRKLRSSSPHPASLLPSHSPTDSHHPLNAMIVKRRDDSPPSTSSIDTKDILFDFCQFDERTMRDNDTRNIISNLCYFRNESKFRLFNLHESCDTKLPTFDIYMYVCISKTDIRDITRRVARFIYPFV